VSAYRYRLASTGPCGPREWPVSTVRYLSASTGLYGPCERQVAREGLSGRREHREVAE
jgi:hypothetical protein